MTRLITSITSYDLPEGVKLALEAIGHGADWVELRLDGWDRLPESDLALLDQLPAGRWVATCRSADEGGEFSGELADRVSRLLAVAARSDCYVDFEWADWQRSANIRQKVRLAAAVRGQLAADQQRLVLSSHDFSGRPADPIGLLEEMGSESDLAAVKMAWRALHICDNFLAFEAMRQVGALTIVICMGEAGLLSRVLSRKFGAFASYCATAVCRQSAPGQLTQEEMVERYRWDQIGPETKLFGVIGDPVRHSMSPALFNALFAKHKIDAVYLPLLTDTTGDVFTRFLRGCADRPWLDVGGFSVTVPHKQAARNFVGSQVEPLAQRIGAVNTLVLTEVGLSGFNTDYAGALEAITDALNCDRSDLSDLRVEVLGAGGVARAITAGLCDCGAVVTLFNRSPQRAKKLSEEFGCASRPWEERNEPSDAELLINCTSVGMWPAHVESPLSPDRFLGKPAVFDTVYNPLETRLLRDAKGAGCKTIDGVSMFVRQAAAQFKLWTGLDGDLDFMRSVVVQELTKTSSGEGQG